MPKYSEDKKMLIDKLIRQKVLEEANKLLKQERPNLFTMRELAENMGVSKATLYNYFTDKYDVIFFIEGQMAAKGEKAIAKIIKEPKDYQEALYLCIKHLYQTYKKYTYIFTAATMARIDLYSKDEKTLPAPGGAMQELIFDFLKRGIAAGAFVQESPGFLHDYMTIILGGINLHPYVHLKGTPMDMKFSEDTMDKIIRYAVAGVCCKN